MEFQEKLFWKNFSEILYNGDSYMEFQEKIIFEEFFRNFVQTKTILYQNLWNFALLSTILFRVRIALKNSKKIHKSTFIYCLYPGNEARP